MIKNVGKDIVSSDMLLQELMRAYPEADALSLCTHTWIQRATTSLDEAVGKCLAAKGVSSARFLVMLALESAKEGLRPSVLASELSVTQATMTGLIDGLEKKGLVRRRASREDRRSCAVALTPKGLRLVSECRPSFHKTLEVVYATWSATEKKQISMLLEKFCRALHLKPEET